MTRIFWVNQETETNESMSISQAVHRAAWRKSFSGLGCLQVQVLLTLILIEVRTSSTPLWTALFFLILRRMGKKEAEALTLARIK